MEYKSHFWTCDDWYTDKHSNVFVSCGCRNMNGDSLISSDQFWSWYSNITLIFSFYEQKINFKINNQNKFNSEIKNMLYESSSHFAWIAAVMYSILNKWIERETVNHCLQKWC